MSTAWRSHRALAGLRAAVSGLLLALAGAAGAQTYTSASTAYALIDSSTHAKLGGNTTPYKFTAASGCGTSPPILDDALSDALPIGFTFTYGTTNHTTVQVMTNGRLQFANATCGAGTASIGPPQTYPYGYPVSTMNNTMKIFGVDLDPTNLVDKPNYPSASNKTSCLDISTCYVSYATLGTAPARQFVVTWKNVPEYVSATNSSGSFDLQVILNEDGTFVYQFGNIVHGGTGTAQIGWQLTTSNYQVLSFGASAEPPPNTAIKFYLPAPLASYNFDEAAWASGVAGQVIDSATAARPGTALGSAQTTSNGKVCRAADIPAHTTAGAVDAVRTGLNIGNSAINLLGTGTAAFWYRSNVAWTGASAQSAQLLDATAVNGEWFYLSKTSTGTLVFTVKDSAGTLRSVSTPAQAIAANTWVHIAVSWNFNGNAAANQDALQIFVNAAAPTTAAFTSSGTVTSQVGFLHLGDNALGIAEAQGSTNSANGQIDEVRVYNYVLTTAQVNTVMLTTRSCAGYTIDHLELIHASGSGLTCTPGTVTIRACQTANCSALYTGGVSGTLTATGSPTTNFDGSSGNGPGARFAIPAGSSSVTKNLQVTTAGSVLLGLSGLSPAATAATTCNFGAPSCTFSAASAGFIFSVPHHVAEASQALSISAVRSSDSSLTCIPAFASTTKAVGFTCSHVNPTSGTLPVRVGGVALNAANSVSAACDGSGSSVSLNFNASGVASTTLQYADVGSMTVNARYAPSSGTESGLVMTGSAGFITRPAGFVVSAITQTAAPKLANPAASTASGARFIPAGEPFSATVKAVNTAGGTSPNYGRETAPEGVLLTRTLVLPSGGATGTLANGNIAGGSFSGGVATVTNLSFSEVGIITLTPSVADGNYLGQGNVTGSASANIGRFVPARFALSSTLVAHRATLSCSPASSFTYLGENFRLGLTLTAQNTTGSTTQNYTGSLAKLDPANAGGWNLLGRDASTVFSVATGRLSLGSASGSWNNGVASGVTLSANASRASAPDGPFNAAFGVAPVDSDGVAMAAFDLASSAGGSADRSSVGTVALRFGRLRIDNAIGAADRTLDLPVRAQHWNGTAFDTNGLDSCTTLPTSSLNFGNLRRTLTPADTAANAAIVLSAGVGSLRLAAPLGGHSGTYDVALSLGATATDASCLQPWAPASGDAASSGANLAHLRGAWCGSAYDKDPAARASFGLQRGNETLVYRRENY